MKKIIKQEKGVTVVSVAIAIIIILIITTMLAYSAKDTVYIKSLTNLYNDIEALRGKISTYYAQYGDIPARIQYILPDDWGNVKGANDIDLVTDENGEQQGGFYVIDLKELDGLTLNYGEGYESIKNQEESVTGKVIDDLYIINKNSHNIFYVKGVKVPTKDGTKMYYTDEENIDDVKVALKKPEVTQEITVEKVMLGPEETVDLKVTTYPTKIDEKLIYESENKDIATVTQDGQVTGIKEGITTITVKGEKSNVTGTCEVMVSYVGYYADLDADGEADGIIYADLAIEHEEAQWSNNDGKYKYNKETEGLNQYAKESEEYTSDKFGGYKAPMVKLVENSSKGKERFYVMDLEDYDKNTHTWYASAYGKGLPTEKAVKSSVSDFEKDSGKINTDYWIGINNNENYQSTNGKLGDNDIWKILNGQLHKKDKDWFVPSRAEWSAFADMCATKVEVIFGDSVDPNYSNFGISDDYWSSSLGSTKCAWHAYFGDGYMGVYDITDGYYVRLSTTF